MADRSGAASLGPVRGNRTSVTWFRNAAADAPEVSQYAYENAAAEPRMEPTAFFLEDRVNLLAGALALVLFGAGVGALARRRGVASVFLLLGGFVVVMFLEYRHLDHSG